MIRIAAALLVVCLLTVACGPEEPASILDEGARFPDAAGVVTDISAQSVQLDDGSTYAISPEVESFTSKEHLVTALLRWKDGWYVHIGLEGDSVIWIAGIGLARGDSGQVNYPGVFDRMERGHAIFADGTAFMADEGVEPLPEDSEALAIVDVQRDVIVELRAQGAGAG